MAYILSSKQDIPIIRVFLASKILLVLQWFLLSMQEYMGDFYTVGLANVLFIFASYYEIYCLVFAKKVFQQDKFTQFHILPVLFSVVFLMFYDSHEYIRIIVLSIIVIIYYSIGAFLLLRTNSKFRIQQFIAIFYIIIVILFVTTAITANNFDDQLSIFSSENVQAVSYTFLTMVSMFLVVVLLLLLKEKDEERMKTDNEQLNELISTKDKFFSIIAHDLKNPIGALSQLGQLLLENHNEFESNEREEVINSITKSSKNTYNLLENLLQWARVESGELTANPKKISVYDIVEANLTLLKQSIASKSITAKSTIDTDLFIFADIEMTNAVIRNILSNAIKFTPNNGGIMISAQKYEVRDLISIRFTDTGVGMPQQVVEKILELDSVYSTSGTNKEKGTGLGLKLCKEFLLKNKGSIRIDSEENVGTSFIITLPIFHEHNTKT